MSEFNSHLPPSHSRVDVVSEGGNIINELAKRYRQVYSFEMARRMVWLGLGNNEYTRSAS